MPLEEYRAKRDFTHTPEPATGEHAAGKPLSFVVHPERTHQDMVGFGAGFNENAEALMETIVSPRERGKAYDLLYGDPGTRLNIVRLVVSPTAEALPPGGGHTRYDWAHNAGTAARTSPPVTSSSSSSPRACSRSRTPC